jgi:hypothetical protein
LQLLSVGRWLAVLPIAVRPSWLAATSCGAHLTDAVVIEERGRAILRHVHAHPRPHDDRLGVIHVHRLSADEPD